MKLVYPTILAIISFVLCLQNGSTQESTKIDKNSMLSIKEDLNKTRSQQVPIIESQAPDALKNEGQYDMECANVCEKIENNKRLLQAVEQPTSDETDTETPNENSDPLIHGDGTETEGDKGWLYTTMEGLGYSFGFILMSEIGDKTFLFIVLYATRMNGFKLLIISSIGLCGMHCIGTALGGVFQIFFTPFWLKLMTVIAFFIFGLALIYMGITDKEVEEDFDHKMHEIELEMLSDSSRKLTKNQNNNSESLDPDKQLLRDSEEEELEEQDNYNIVESQKEGIFTKIYKVLAFNQAMKIILTIFVTEMGDRSQISAIGLAAQYPFWIVAFAGSIGHIFALILAILFGKAVSDYTTEKCINITGGILFLIFSAYSILIYYVLEDTE